MVRTLFQAKPAGKGRILRMIFASTAVLLGILALFLVPSGGAVYADGPTPDTVPSDWTPDSTLQSYINKKQQLVDLYAKVGKGETTMSAYNAALDSFYSEESYKEVHHPDNAQTAAECSAIPSANRAYLSDGTCYDTSEGSFTSTVPTSNTGPTSIISPLSVRPRHRQRVMYQVPQLAQNNGYYCGPAAAAEVLSFWQAAYHEPSTSFFGDSFSQSSLAAQCSASSYGCRYTRGKYLMTDANGVGGTDWRWHALPYYPYIYMMEFGLNNWRQGTEHGDYVPAGLPQEDITFMTLQTFGDRWITDIDAAFPMVADVAENRSNRGVVSTHLVNHPSGREIYHWVTIRGYSTPGYYDNQWWVHYVDSVWGSSLNNTNGYALTQGNNRLEFLTFHKLLEAEGFGYIW